MPNMSHLLVFSEILLAFIMVFQLSDAQVELKISVYKGGTVLARWTNESNLTASILSYSFVTDISSLNNITSMNISISPASNEIVINGTFFGHNYTFDLLCAHGDQQLIKCASVSFFTFPSCLEGWAEYEGNCYYFSKEVLTFGEAVRECELLEDMASSGTPLIEMQIDAVANQSQSFAEDLFWVGSTPSCLDKSHGGNCCIAMPDLGSPMNRMTRFGGPKHCSTEENLRYVCNTRLHVFENTSTANNIRITQLNSSSVNATWDVLPNFWIPEEWTLILSCDDHSLHGPILHSYTTSVLLNNLTYGKEYMLTIQPGHYGDLLHSGTKKHFLISDDIFYKINITSNGEVGIQWPINAHVEEGYMFVITSPPNKSINMTKEQGVKLSGFQFGQNETFTITAVNTSRQVFGIKNFTVLIVPTCNQNEFQSNLTCYKLLKEETVWQSAFNICKQLGGKLATPTTNESYDHLIEMSGYKDINSSFWITGSTNLSHSNEPTNLTDHTISFCKYVNHKVGEVNLAKCDQYLAAMCERQIEVQINKVENVKIVPVNSSFIIVTWTEPSSWRPTVINVTCTELVPSTNGSGKRRKREADPTITKVNDNSAIISQLKPSTDYSISVTSEVTSPQLQTPIRSEPITMTTKTPPEVTTTTTPVMTTQVTTEALTTEVSTTEVSTTEATTTEASTTEASTTEASTTEAITTEAITTEAITTEKATTVVDAITTARDIPTTTATTITSTTNVASTTDSEAYTTNYDYTEEDLIPIYTTRPTIVIGAADYSHPLSTSISPHLFALMRFISSAILIGFLCISVLIQIFCRMFVFRDCLANIFLEMSLIAAHICVYVGNEFKRSIFCKAVSIANQFFFLSCFCFLALQSMCILKSMTRFLPIGFFAKRRYIFFIGWGLPACMVGISAGLFYRQYCLADSRYIQQCWVSFGGNIFYMTAVPILVFLTSSILHLMLSFCARPTNNYAVDEESYIRHKPMEDMRWVMLFISVLMGCDWVGGMLAFQKQDDLILVSFFVINIILGLSFFLLRCIGDDEIRYRMRLCCAKPTIRPEEHDMIQNYVPEGATYMQRGLAIQPLSINMSSSLIFKRSYNFQP